MLRACRRALRPGGRIAFLTIEPQHGLDSPGRRRAHRAGPPGVSVPTSYRSLLGSARFVDIVAVDVTDDYRATQRRWIDAMARYEGELRTSMGDEMYDERAARRARTLRAIDDGLLARTRYSATRPAN